MFWKGRSSGSDSEDMSGHGARYSVLPPTVLLVTVVSIDTLDLMILLDPVPRMVIQPHRIIPIPIGHRHPILIVVLAPKPRLIDIIRDFASTRGDASGVKVRAVEDGGLVRLGGCALLLGPRPVLGIGRSDDGHVRVEEFRGVGGGSCLFGMLAFLLGRPEIVGEVGFGLIVVGVLQ